jgi:redox-sensitive bicupin YhaK (pirin superfamily)
MASNEPVQEAVTDGVPVAGRIVPRTRDLGGGFEVRRVLPHVGHRMVGPFIFFDAMGPTQFAPGQGLDVRPHPHIGLATVTYLFEGEILHRDSLGSLQPIRPGDVNWMVAGRGIAHSERTAPELRQSGTRLRGLQSWIALPHEHEETAPRFDHHPARTLPLIEGEGVSVRLIAGALFGKEAPVRSFSDMIYADIALAPGARLALPRSHAERALWLVEGEIEIGGAREAAGQMLLLGAALEITIAAAQGARLMLLGGEPMDGPRHIWWNFVSSSQERIELAKAEWKAGRFAAVPGESEFIPLPE